MRRLVLIALMSLLMLGEASAASKGIVADIDTHLVAITTDFTGQDILVFGAVSEPGDVVIVIRGPQTEIRVSRKERVMGVWVNAESMTFKDVPSLYGVASSRPLYEIMLPETLDRYQLGPGRIRINLLEGDPRRQRIFSNALVTQKRNQGLYAERVGRVIFVGDTLFRANLHLPSNVPTGTFLIDCYLVRDGKIVAAQNMPLVISKVGFGADVYKFANAPTAGARFAYGLVAATVAFLLGWLAHLLFRRR